MSLKRKENNLRKAQARFEKVSRRTKQFQIDFRREQNKHGKFKTKAYIVRGEKVHHGGKGIIHRAVNLKYRVKGDKLSVTRTINSFQPKSKKGKLFKANAQAVNFVVHDTVQTAVDTALAAETVGIKTADTAQREVRQKLKQKYTREAVDDYHRGIFFMGRTAVDAVKGTHNHLKTKKQYKLEKAKYKLKKADNKLFKPNTYKPKMAQTKADLKKAKAEYKSQIVRDRGNKFRKAMNKRRLQKYKQTKRELKFERKKVRFEKRFRTKELRIQKKIACNSDPGLLVLKPAKYTANRMRASAWQKAVNEDQDNDFLHAIDSAKRRIIEPTAQKASKPRRLQRQEKKRDSLNDKKAKSENKLKREDRRLKEKHDSYKKRKKKAKPKNKQAKKSVSAVINSAWKYVKNVYEKEVKKFFGAVAVPILIILLVFAFVLMIFSSVVSGGGFTLGTYAAQDYDLSEAEKYYTKLAYGMNEKILKVSDSSDWKNGLTDFGAEKKDLKDKPDNWYWGKSAVYNWEPVYDFDCYKLWAFLCAYYQDFDNNNGDIKYWQFKGDTQTLLEEIFNSEYEFVYNYDNQSKWEYRSSFESRGYYAIESSGITGEYGYIVISYPDALPFSGYCNDDTIYFNPGNGEVLNYNDEYAATGWYLKDQFVNDTDPDGNTYEGYYQNGETCTYGHYENGVLVTPNPYVIPEESWCSFLKKYDWKTDCRLYYNVRQKKTFDKVIEDKLKAMSHKTERLAYYDLLIGNDGGEAMYGNHQTIHDLLPKDSIRDYTFKREFGYEMVGWNEESDGLFQGIKVSCTSGEKLTAPFDCKIKNVDTANNKITLRKDDVMYWYDGTGGTKRDTEIEIVGAVPIGSYAEGDMLKEGDEFAKTTADNVDFHINIDTDGCGWDYIDPRLVLY